MVGSTTTTNRNQLRGMLAARDRRLLEPDLEPVTLPLRFYLEQPDKPIRHVYFPDVGIISVVVKSSHGREIEAGIIGREGMSGIAVVMGDDRTPNATYVQAAGRGHRIAADDLRRAMKESPSLRKCLLHFAQAFMTQTAHTALANGRAKIAERLARWILMAHDRTDGDELPLTHEFLALMLGVRRPGVTSAVQQLERRGLIDTRRGRFVVLDRAALETMADGSYGYPEAEYLRLTGWRPGRRLTPKGKAA